MGESLSSGMEVLATVTSAHASKDLRRSLKGRRDQNGKLKSSKAELVIFLQDLLKPQSK